MLHVMEFKPSSPPDLDGIPSALGPLPGPEELVGRLYTLPLDLAAERHGPLFYADYDGERKLYACSAQLVEELCDESRFAKNLTHSLARLRPLAGDGLFTSYYGEPNWQKAHDVLLPGFSYAGIRNYHSAMLDINQRLINRWDAHVGKQPVDVSTDLQKLAIDTVALAGFGVQFNSFDIDGMAPIPATFNTALTELILNGQTPEFTNKLATLHTFFDELIAAHRSGSADAVDDLLSTMLGVDADGAPLLDRDNVNNQIMTFMIAGQLTTSELMPNTLYNIIHHPAVLDRVRAEVDAVFGADDDYLPSYEDIGKFSYLRLVINETLRLSPPVAKFDRMALSDTIIGGKYPVKKGEVVTVPTGALHRQPEWGDNVEFFDPERFTPERSAGRSGSVFKPFGTGARSCIGRQFALHEATMAIARLVHRYRLIDSEHYVLRWDGPNSRRPAGFHLEVARRTAEDRRQQTAPATESVAPQTSATYATVLKPGTTLAVLHGSNLGTCRALANQLAEEAADGGCTTSVAPLDSATGGLPDTDVTVIIASSYNGQPTDDAKEFLAWLNGPDAVLKGSPTFAVLGVGDHNWTDTYQAIPKRIDERLAELGGTRLVPLASADTSGDFTGTVEEFSTTARAAMVEHFGDPDAVLVSDADEPLYELRTIPGPITKAIDTRFAVVPMTIVENLELVSGKAFGQAKRYVRVALPTGTEYHTGDHLTVLADNSPQLVDAVTRLLQFDPDLRLSVNPRRKSRRLIALDREVSVRELLTHFVELRKPASRSQLKRLALSNPVASERQRLEELATSSEANVLSTLECLLEFPSCEVTAAELLELLEPMTPRHYSIASSSRLSPQVVGLVVSVVDAPARSGRGAFQGVASNHLAAMKTGQQIRARVDPARQAFRAGALPTRNVILVSAGTGVAPFRGFLLDRFAAQQAGEPFAPALCFFGVRDPIVDYIFREEFEKGEALGVVRMRPAFSRAPENGVRYVQDRIAADADDVWEMLGDPAKDTYVYVCGDGGQMAPAVRKAFQDIYQARTGSDAAQAQAWLNGLVESDRYVEDVWAG